MNFPKMSQKCEQFSYRGFPKVGGAGGWGGGDGVCVCVGGEREKRGVGGVGGEENMKVSGREHV